MVTVTLSREPAVRAARASTVVAAAVDRNNQKRKNSQQKSILFQETQRRMEYSILFQNSNSSGCTERLPSPVEIWSSNVCAPASDPVRRTTTLASASDESHCHRCSVVRS
jgi:hypothetical protein